MTSTRGGVLTGNRMSTLCVEQNNQYLIIIRLQDSYVQETMNLLEIMVFWIKYRP